MRASQAKRWCKGEYKGNVDRVLKEQAAEG